VLRLSFWALQAGCSRFLQDTAGLLETSYFLWAAFNSPLERAKGIELAFLAWESVDGTTLRLADRLEGQRVGATPTNSECRNRAK
jgi:hypothetical protein